MRFPVIQIIDTTDRPWQLVWDTSVQRVIEETPADDVPYDSQQRLLVDRLALCFEKWIKEQLTIRAPKDAKIIDVPPSRP